jgi:hypothetical protein
MWHLRIGREVPGDKPQPMKIVFSTSVKKRVAFEGEFMIFLWFLLVICITFEK